MSAIALILRRACACATDVALLTGLTLGALVVFEVVANSEWSLFWSGVLPVMVFLYFGVTEGLWGASAGKMLFRLRVRRWDQERLGFYDSFLRIFLILFVPELVLFVRRIAATQNSLFASGVLSATVMLTTWCMWPISVLVSYGRLGLHDLVAKTEVVDVGSRVSPEVVAGGRYFGAIAAAVFVFAIGVFGVASRFREIFQQMFGSGVLMQEYTLTPTPAELLNGLDNRDAFPIESVGIGPADVASLSGSVFQTRFPKPFNARPFTPNVAYTVEVGWRGLFAGDFKREIALRVASAYVAKKGAGIANGVATPVVAVSFEHRLDLDNVVVAISNRIVALPELRGGLVYFTLADPDRAWWYEMKMQKEW